MHADPPDRKTQVPRPGDLAARFEGMVGVILVVAIVILAVGLIYGVLTTENTDPKWIQ